MITLNPIDIVAICFFLIGFFFGNYKKTHKKTTCAYVARPIIPGDRKDGWNEPPTCPKPHEYRPIIEGDRKDYNPPPTSQKPQEYRPLSSGLWGRKDRKDEPTGPKPTTRPWSQ